MYRPSDISSSTSPVSSSTWWAVWKKAPLQPSVATFEDIANDPNATFGRGLKWIFFSALISGSSFAITGLGSSSFADVFGYLIIVPLISVIMYPIVIGVIHLIASVLGGTGTFTKLAFAYAAFQAPLAIISSLIGIIIGPLLPGLVLIPYGLVLQVIAVKAVYRFGWAKAVIAALSLQIVVLVLVGFFLLLVMFTID